MSDSYQELLEATLQNLRELKATGRRYVSVDIGMLETLGSTPTVVQPARQTFKTVANIPVGPTDSPALDSAAAVPQSKPTPVPAPAAEPTNSPQDSLEARLARFQSLRHRVEACDKCPALVKARKNVVFGIGNVMADLMFVGEAPGADEDQQGEPFVGKAGQLLTKIIQTMGLSREQVYIANILKCRPDTPGQSTGNRKPTAEEMVTCIPYLQEQIEIIKPKVLVALGATALEGLLGAPTSITRARGQWRQYRGIPLMPTYHPAYLLRNQSLSEKRRVWEDMLQVMEKLGMAISPKQRGYFLSQ